MFPAASFAQPQQQLASIQIKQLQTYIYEAHVSKPVVSSMATISKRVALLVRIEDQDGAFGWGEIYATMPSFGAPHRAHIVHQVLATLLHNQAFKTPSDCWQFLQHKTHNLQIQTGEAGPFSAAIAGMDCALWDLYARKQNLPLAQCLGANLRPLPVYASGLNPADGPEVVIASRERGFRAYKQKIGFGTAKDISILEEIFSTLPAQESLMVDINQAWSIDQIKEIAPLLARFPLRWIEEPLQADRPVQEWAICRKLFNQPIAGGENLRANDFGVHSDYLDVIQPDVGKWGGISACYAIAKEALTAGKVYCPHWLGSGLGLMASAHLLCAVGGPGLLEMDVNENPLRDILANSLPQVISGEITLTSQPGIGVLPDIQSAANFLTHYQETIL